jgi:hypothetical protein
VEGLAVAPAVSEVRAVGAWAAAQGSFTEGKEVEGDTWGVEGGASLGRGLTTWELHWLLLLLLLLKMTRLVSRPDHGELPSPWQKELVPPLKLLPLLLPHSRSPRLRL